MPATFFNSSTEVKSLGQNLNLNEESLVTNGEFSATNNTADQNITGLAFSTSTTAAADVLLRVAVDATTDLYETYKLLIVNKGGVAFNMAVTSVGDASLVTFAITSGGQVQVTTPSYGGFVSCTLKFTVNEVKI